MAFSFTDPKFLDFAGNSLQDLGYGLATGSSIGNAFGAATKRSAEMDPIRQANAEKKSQTNATIAFFKTKGYDDLVQRAGAGEPLANLYQEAISRSTPQAPDAYNLSPGQGHFVDGKMVASMPSDAGGGGADPADVATYKYYANDEMKAGRKPKSFDEWFTGTKQGSKAGLGQPIPLKNRKTGEYVPFEPMSDGSMVNTLTGEKANPQDWLFDPGMVNSDKAAGTAYGTSQGGAQFNLPAAKQNVETELANIQALKNDPQGIEETFGKLGGVIPQQMTPTLPGTKRADYATRLDQVKGQNFLQAYSTLRGAGAITEAEGAKAQDAMGRLSTSQTKEAYMQALGDLEQVLTAGYQRMGQQASMGPYQSNGFTPAPIGSGPSADDLVTKYLGQ
jgi:hypothetical protein